MTVKMLSDTDFRVSIKKFCVSCLILYSIPSVTFHTAVQLLSLKSLADYEIYFEEKKILQPSKDFGDCQLMSGNITRIIIIYTDYIQNVVRLYSVVSYIQRVAQHGVIRFPSTIMTFLLYSKMALSKKLIIFQDTFLSTYVVNQ